MGYSPWGHRESDMTEQAHTSMFHLFAVSMLTAFLVAKMVKNLPAMQKTQVQSLGQEDPLEEEMATHSSILAWRVPWTEEPGRLQSKGSPRVGATNTFTFIT